MLDPQPSAVSFLGRGVVAGIAGTAVMTVFQRVVEMPVTRRKDSYAPADFAEKVMRVEPDPARGRRRLNESYVQAQAVGAVFDRLLDPVSA